MSPFPFRSEPSAFDPDPVRGVRYWARWPVSWLKETAKDTKIMKVFDSLLFFVSFEHFMIENMIYQSDLIPSLNQVIVS